MRKQISALSRRGNMRAIYIDLNNPRRFAGDYMLGRNRYYSLCADESGNDSGCLRNELLAYRRPEFSGEVSVADSQVTSDFEALKSRLPFKPRSSHIYVLFHEIVRAEYMPSRHI